MRVLLDECLPTVLRHELPEHDVRTVKHMGWTGIDNGELLRLMVEGGFEAFVTIDQNLRFQQNMRDARIAIVELAASFNRIEAQLPLLPQLGAALARIRPGELIRVEA